PIRTLYRAGVMGYWRLNPPETYPAGLRNARGLPMLGLTPEGRATLAKRNATRREWGRTAWGAIWTAGLGPFRDDPFDPSVPFKGVKGRSPQACTDLAEYGVKTIYEIYNDMRHKIL